MKPLIRIMMMSIFLTFIYGGSVEAKLPDKEKSKIEINSEFSDNATIYQVDYFVWKKNEKKEGIQRKQKYFRKILFHQANERYSYLLVPWRLAVLNNNDEIYARSTNYWIIGNIPLFSCNIYSLDNIKN